MTPAEIADVLESSGRAYTNLVGDLPRALASWRPAPEEWCVKECLGHVILAENLAFAGRIRFILRENEPNLLQWDPAEKAGERLDCERDPADLIAEFEPVRRASLGLVRSLTPQDLRRGGMHPKVERLTVDDLLHEWVHHDGNHLRQAYANVQGYVWSNMGNTRRFSSA